MFAETANMCYIVAPLMDFTKNAFPSLLRVKPLALDIDIMEKKEFATIRKKLGKTQKEIAILLGISLKAVCSYEQGWRTIPVHVERQVIFLLSRKMRRAKQQQPCWLLKNCPEERKTKCPAWEFDSGEFCWFISGTICECAAQKTWDEKILVCKECIVMRDIR